MFNRVDVTLVLLRMQRYRIILNMKKEIAVKILNDILEHLGMSVKQFSDSLGKDRPQWAYDVLNPGKKVGISQNIADLIIEHYPQFNKFWLLTGEGCMLQQSEAAIYNAREIVRIPLVSQYAYAGYLSGYSDHEYMDNLPTIDFMPDRHMTGNYVAFEVRGDSMDDGTSDGYLCGEILICREVEQDYWRDSKLFINKRDFVIVHKEGILIKRIIKHDVENHVITIHSLNPLYPDKEIDLAEVKQIFSVVESRRQRRR